jgi:hypothetical protein
MKSPAIVFQPLQQQHKHHHEKSPKPVRTELRGGDRKAARKTHLGFCSLAGDAAGPLRLRWPSSLGGVADHGLSPAEGFSFFVRLFPAASSGW